MSQFSENSNTSNATFIMGTVMFVVYLIFGMVLIFTPVFEPALGANKNLLGAIVLLYGSFRFWMTLRLRKGKTQKEKTHTASNILGFGYYFGMVMILVYILAGLVLLFSSAFVEYLGSFKPILGILLIGYGGFRIWMTIKINKLRNASNQD